MKIECRDKFDFFVKKNINLFLLLHIHYVESDHVAERVGDLARAEP